MDVLNLVEVNDGAPKRFALVVINWRWPAKINTDPINFNRVATPVEELDQRFYVVY